MSSHFVRNQFISHSQVIYGAISEQLINGDINVREASVKALGQIAVTLFEINYDIEMIENILLSLIRVLNDDTEFPVVLCACEELITLLTYMEGHDALSINSRDAILSLINSIWGDEVACLRAELEDEAVFGDFYEQLLDKNCILLLRFGEATIRPGKFAINFDVFITKVIPHTKESAANIPEIRCYAYGTIADGLQILKEFGQPYITDDLVNIYLKAIQDDDVEVRRSASFGLGVQILYKRTIKAVDYKVGRSWKMIRKLWTIFVVC